MNLLALVFELRADDPQPRWPVDLGAKLRAAFYQLLGETEPALAQAVHDWPRPGPLTLAPLKVPKDDLLPIRLTVLDGELIGLLTPALLELRDRRLRLGATWSTVQQVHVTAAEHPLAGEGSYEALLEAEPCAGWELRFLTPATFKNEKVHLPLPTPALMWGSWARRWNDFCRPDDRFEMSFLDRLHDHVQLSGGGLKLGRCKLTGRDLPGFVGDLSIELVGRPEEDYGRILNALAEYANYAGTGRETFAGLGVTTCRSVTR